LKKLLFITLAAILVLSVSLIGCGTPATEEYDLTVASGLGGDVTTPTEGTHTYDEGDVVNLVATPFTEYDFVNWTGDVSGIADVNDPTTTITMNGDYEITANFEWGGGDWTDETVLTFHCTAGETASLWLLVYKTWVEGVEADSGPDGGTFNFTVTFGETPYTPEDSLQYLSDGTVDVGQLSTDTFNLGAIGYLPFIFSMSNAAYATHYIYEEEWDALGELDDVHMLLGSPLQPAQWWGAINVTQLSDIEGEDVRAEGKEVPIIDALGANAIEVGTGDIYSQLESGLIKGCFFTYSGGVFWLALHEVTDYTSEVNLVLPRYMLAMNREAYEGLHPDARALLDEHSTAAVSVALAQAHEAGQAGAKDKLENGGYPVFGNTRDIYEIPQSELDNWVAACDPVFDDFVTDLNALGFDGQGILDRVYELIDEYEALP
jgi:TRAP-type C4-dicarboxylate transport system substrate-binding protein